MKYKNITDDVLLDMHESPYFSTFSLPFFGDTRSLKLPFVLLICQSNTKISLRIYNLANTRYETKHNILSISISSTIKSRKVSKKDRNNFKLFF